MTIIKSKTLTEFKIQNILFYWSVRKKNHVLGLPNTYLYNWESDFISMTAANYVHEYEIKISRSDFRVDFKKPRHALLLEGRYGSGCPSYFWYVMPDGLVDLEDIPDHAGLLYIMKGNRVSIRRKARKLSKLPATDTQINKLLVGSMWRYWSMRQKLDELESK